VRRGKLRELDAPERGPDVQPDYLPVTLVSARAHASSVGVLEPAIEVPADRDASGVEHETARAVGERPGQLVGRLLARLAVEDPALGPARRVGGIACLLATVLAPGDRALAVSAPPRHP
jgi:hypothetical protein